jgi:hypothetical protein
MMETWFVMEDGTVGDPRDVSPDTTGRLHHKDGRAVQYRSDGETPRSRGVDAGAERAKAVPVVTNDMRAGPAKAYRTREAKAG